MLGDDGVLLFPALRGAGRRQQHRRACREGGRLGAEPGEGRGHGLELLPRLRDTGRDEVLGEHGGVGVRREHTTDVPAGHPGQRPEPHQCLGHPQRLVDPRGGPVERVVDGRALRRRVEQQQPPQPRPQPFRRAAGDQPAHAVGDEHQPVRLRNHRLDQRDQVGGHIVDPHLLCGPAAAAESGAVVGHQAGPVGQQRRHRVPARPALPLTGLEDDPVGAPARLLHMHGAPVHRHCPPRRLPHIRPRAAHDVHPSWLMISISITVALVK